MLVALAACNSSPGRPAARPSSTGVPPASPGLTKRYHPTFGPRSDQLVDLSWVDPRRGWALVGRACGPDHTRCAVVFRTLDGGRTWARLASLPAEIGTVQRGALTGGWLSCEPAHPCVGALHFVTPGVGYAYGPSMFMTTDGGRSWSRIPGERVESLSSSGSEVFRIAYGGTGCPGPCKPIIQESKAGTRAWRTVPTHERAGGGFGESILAGGSNLYVFFWGHIAGGFSSHATIEVSRDEGRTWSVRTDPCGFVSPHSEEDAAAASAVGDSLGILCVSKIGTGPTFTALSNDAGRTFTRGRAVRIGAPEQIAIDGAGDIAVGNAGTTGSGGFAYTLSLSHDDGRTWRVALRDREAVAEDLAGGYLQFVSPRDLFWVGNPYFLWQSFDGGGTWQELHAP